VYRGITCCRVTKGSENFASCWWNHVSSTRSLIVVCVADRSREHSPTVIFQPWPRYLLLGARWPDFFSRHVTSPQFHIFSRTPRSYLNQFGQIP
jgi:hypothetical protein